MVIRLRTAFFIILGVLILGFLYLQREILAPFILGAIFAYILDPLVNVLSRRVRIPRTLSVIVIYILIISALITAGFFLIRQVILEYDAFLSYVLNLINDTRGQIKNLPPFIRPAVAQALDSAERLQFITASSLFVAFPQAVSRIVSFFIFLFSGFYFLREGGEVFQRILNWVPSDYRIEVEILLRKINQVLERYLRGQLLIILTSFVMFFIFLSVLGVPFALVLAIFSGIGEVIPYIGPLLTGAVIAIIVFASGGIENFPLNQIQSTLLVIVISFIIRQIQDYLVTPNIMGRVVNLHPLFLLFAVVAGGQIAGVLGLILAIPVAAVIKIILEYSLDKINERTQTSTKKASERE